MCDKLTFESIEAIGQFDKRGDGQIQQFPVIVAECECGETTWARVAGGYRWVEAVVIE